VLPYHFGIKPEEINVLIFEQKETGGTLFELARRLYFMWSGTDVAIRRKLPMFAPNSAGDRKSLTNLTMQSAAQTFPFLSKFVSTYCSPRLIILTAEEFCSRFHGQELAAKLEKVFNSARSDKSSIHNYHLIYGVALAAPAEVRNMLEIGMGTNNTDVISNMGSSGTPGASLRAFRDFLPNAHIYGADIDRRILFQEDRISTFFVDQTDLASFDQLGKTNVSFDLIIDDGLHSPDANIAVIIFALKRLTPRGWLVIEDIHVSARSLWETFSALLPNNYDSYLIEAKGALVFAVRERFSGASTTSA
jgi:hypothetical protein